MSTSNVPKHQEIRDGLPDDLKSSLDDLVTDYKFFATKHHGRAFVSYGILADLIKPGWRLSAPSTETKDHTPKPQQGEKNE